LQSIAIKVTSEEIISAVGSRINLHEPLKLIKFYNKSTIFNFFHVIILLKTDNWYWTIEKNDAGIVLQRSKTVNHVTDYIAGQRRDKPAIEANSSRCYGKVKDLLEWLVRTGELHKPYDLLNENCVHFAYRVMSFVMELSSWNTVTEFYNLIISLTFVLIAIMIITFTSKLVQ